MNTLGRREPSDWRHVELYPMRALAAAEQPRSQAVVLGTNWYASMMRPYLKLNNEWWFREDNLGRNLGGHATCLRPDRVTDYGTWWEFYHQKDRNACVGFACARSRSLVERRRYDANWIYDRALEIDEWPGEDDEGTSLRAGFQVMKNTGVRRANTGAISQDESISAYRWLRSVDEIRAVLDSPSNDARQAVRLMSSWGRDFPHFIWLPYTLLERLLNEDGEAATGTPR